MVNRQLGQLERLIRFYAAVNGITVLLFAVIILFWFDLAFDRFFELSQSIRGLAGAAFVFFLAAVIYRSIICTALMPVEREKLAAVFESYVPALNGALLTVVSQDFGKQMPPSMLPPSAPPPDFYSLVSRLASEALSGINVRRFFCVRRLTLLLFCAVLCSATLPAFFVLCGETAAIWLSRNIFISQQDYPRRSLLIADGFQDGTVRIGRGSTFTLSVRADMSKPLVPETIRIRTDNQSVTVEQFTVQTIDSTDYRVFTHTFPELLEPLTLQVRGADTVLGHLRIEVLPVPVLTNFTLHLSYPDYMQRPPQTLPVIGRTMIPDGTNVTLEASVNKPLRRWTAYVGQEEIAGQETTDSSGGLESSIIRCPLSVFRNDMLLNFRLTDIDGLHNRQLIQVDLGVIKDKVPVVTARLDGVGAAITPNAVVPVAGELTDDYGIGSAEWVVERVIEGEASKQERQALKVPNGESSSSVIPLALQYDIAPLHVKAESKLTLFVSAKDKCNLDANAGQIGEGPHWTFEIVTPERLKTLLEVRETTLRQRLEVIIGETERTKTMLTLPVDEYNISRMLRDTQKEVYDQRSIAEAVELIRQEMINNKMMTEDLQQRLTGGIINPLRSIITADFPELDKRIEALKLEADSAKAPCLEQFDSVIKRMQFVRDNMLSLESFNEAVELLRSILHRQEQLRNETQEEKNKRLKRLLEN
ncbi:MAG: hypothetical protein LBT46_12965 [Planctomycetaceae bacterium]|jgi:hypothetical protein|nr:hypothetical protein [Planctomycetaceae bacterium]